ncbi:hypothetical protein METHB2_40103 [Candidatus Methylobacter favarea]|uniref:Uncharacterized protein n=1 Tax=Candidatus Methylobacter favarea TaxID=2707345 RepID=A0A8S0YAA0_9GAMM|nr:hypothetical protein [Candidatus Methylobacter favarea]CAA9891403.1 hypothetical protein METHB2_40103 [Candidatus Methylobacter favarea]
MSAIKHIKRQILAQAGFNKVIRNMGRPSAQGIEQYYQAHPQSLCAQHNAFKLKEVLIAKIDDKGKDKAINKSINDLIP